ncbi:MAG: fasciclin domain-containing protein [Burkholderiaceae bacterium]|nr:fasciclin domain-containing protein [Burkholderiaceae bacterium]
MTFSTPLSLGRRSLLVAALLTSMVGCATRPAPVDVAQTLANTPSLSTLNSLVSQAGLSAALKTGGPFTVFAPSNDAFKAMPAKTMDELAKNPEKLKALLAYHVVPAKLMAADVKNSNVKSVQGSMLALSKAGDFVTVETAAVIQADIAATNGVVHVVDTVLPAPAGK